MTENAQYQDLPLEEVIGDRFGRYSKYIIQDRALPDARDGLKPVQRRILYAMHQEGNTNDKPFRKSAKTVGNVIGNYHPHGDSSVYEAMVRMSQDWKLRHPLIEMHGNNGSLDGDPAAAMRYTEARLSAIASEMLRDIGKRTVEFVPNYDDNETEPTVLPARLPNLLVNGSTGIAAGYATDIPPHALHEVIDAVLMRIDNPAATTDELMTVLRGPDFPTGGIIQGADGIRKAYETGRGKIVIRAKTEIEELRGGKQQIVVTEIPYDVNKANLVKKIDELRLDRKLEGISEVRDESDRTGLRIVVELKKDIAGAGILQYLFKNTDLQVNYNFNMIAIEGRRPKLMSLGMMLDAYIGHRRDVITKRSEFELLRAKDRLHIVEGLMKALSILDEVIRTIRASEDKRDAKNNLVSAFGFTEPQAEAIVSLQLYRLTNTDITELQREQEELNALIEELTGILGSEKKLLRVIKNELREIRKQFSEPRRSVIEEEIAEIKLDLDILIPSEEVVVTVTKDGYVKRTSQRSYGATGGRDLEMKESDRLLFGGTLNTQQALLLFTSLGNYIYQPVHELPDIRWKDLGQHISSIVPLAQDEEIVEALGIGSFDEAGAGILTVTENGFVKRSALADYKVQRTGRTYKAVSLKKGDALQAVHLVPADGELLLFTHLAYGLRFPLSEVTETGVRTAGVKGINLKDGDRVVSSVVNRPSDEEALFLATHRGAVKKMPVSEFELSTRAKRGLVCLKELKSNPHRVAGVVAARKGEQVVLATDKDKRIPVDPGAYRLADRYSNGSFAVDQKEDGYVTNIYTDINMETTEE
ncbi:DNA topoisomerase IV subunit A [Edaphobacillus lindanitolerans]|uniref:DNA topoisomerase 4 subunit A n=1 Tax=Edaphobacillus lindanitolerans TaxID=550447 RepID=A0A1U7PM29_9BACI|nr:DNA topoisomerase IV subunit A [Edaphobacillus lindanitolerans]SIT81010.1 topoisomerase-4 subunit A [Edaphobacillus lindanitolerans]